MKKLIICIFCILLFVSCGENAINPDIPLADISVEVNKVLSNADKLSNVDTALLEGIASLNPDIISDYVIMLQTKGTEIDQYGIFKVDNDKNALELKKSLDNYIEILNKNQADFNYLPTETVKLKNAEAFIAGPYVVYTIMSEDDNTAFNKIFNDMIR